MTDAVLDRAAELLASARRVFVITGAGISADSGLPTYRGIGGLYEDLTEDGVAIEEALSGTMLAAHPGLVWKYIHQIESACRGATPNRGHEVLARLEERLERVCVLTQNVDGFHHRAGSRNVIDIHGDIHELVCTKPSCDFRVRIPDYGALATEPRCPSCGEFLRPNVVLFGEMLPLAKVLRMEKEMKSGIDVLLTVGTSSGFPYIAGPVFEARRMGIPTVEINPGETEVSAAVDLRIRERAAAALDGLWARLSP